MTSNYINVPTLTGKRQILTLVVQTEVRQHGDILM